MSLTGTPQGTPVDLALPDGLSLAGIVYVDSLARLDQLAPANGAGVRTLAIPNTCVVLLTPIVLPPGQRIVLGNSTILKGCDADTSGLIGDVDGPLISGSGDGCVVTGVFLVNPNAGVNAWCVELTNGANPAGRVSRCERTSVAGTRGVRVIDQVSATVNVLDRCTVVGIELEGNNTAIEMNRCVHVGAPGQTPTELVIGGTPQFIRVSNCTYTVLPGHTGIDASGASFALASLPADPGSLLRIGSNDFLPLGGTPLNPADLGDLTDLPGVFLTGNAGVADSTFGGEAGFNGNPTAEQTVISAVGVIQPGGQVTNAVRVGNGNASHPLFTLSPGSGRVELEQPGDADTAVLRWAAIEAANVGVAAALSVRSADGLTKAFAGQIVLEPAGGGPATFVSAFTAVTGGLILAAGFVRPQSTINALDPTAGIAVEVANLTDTVNLIVDSCELSLVSLD